MLSFCFVPILDFLDFKVLANECKKLQNQTHNFFLKKCKNLPIFCNQKAKYCTKNKMSILLSIISGKRMPRLGNFLQKKMQILQKKTKQKNEKPAKNLRKKYKISQTTTK